MQIGGLVPLSLIDYPGKSASVVFLQGCNFRCGYCHNPSLVCPSMFGPRLRDEEVMSFLKGREGKIDGIVVSGGEPTIQRGLVRFLQNLKEMNFAIKLDTNGSNPAMLEEIFREGLVDFVAMDIKTSPDAYAKAVGRLVDPQLIKESIHLIQTAGIEYQFRTVLVRSHCKIEDIYAIKALIGDEAPYALNPFRVSEHMIDSSIANESGYSIGEISALQEQYQVPCPG